MFEQLDAECATHILEKVALEMRVTMGKAPAHPEIKVETTLDGFDIRWTKSLHTNVLDLAKVFSTLKLPPLTRPSLRDDAAQVKVSFPAAPLLAPTERLAAESSSGFAQNVIHTGPLEYRPRSKGLHGLEERTPALRARQWWQYARRLVRDHQRYIALWKLRATMPVELDSYRATALAVFVPPRDSGTEPLAGAWKHNLLWRITMKLPPPPPPRAAAGSKTARQVFVKQWLFVFEQRLSVEQVMSFRSAADRQLQGASPSSPF
jgi:hypothetical protein